jgi:mono/diheme cytochrome c family protein
LLVFVLVTSLASFGKSDGAWLKKVSEADRRRTNPFAGNTDAVAAGRNLYLNNCAKCHGKDATGKGSRPSLRSQRLRQATDGEIAWIVKNGNLYKGMPSWGGLPEQERWQIEAYIRSLNTEVRP